MEIQIFLRLEIIFCFKNIVFALKNFFCFKTFFLTLRKFFSRSCFNKIIHASRKFSCFKRFFLTSRLYFLLQENSFLLQQIFFSPQENFCFQFIIQKISWGELKFFVPINPFFLHRKKILD